MIGLKRIIDISFSLVGLMLLLPLLLIVAILIKLDSPGQVFFIQKRIGRGFKPFNLYKFRTMIDAKSEKDISITPEDNPRISKIGRFLRKTKIDELPQLFNVFKGEMSLVGPRPELPSEVAAYNEEERKLLSIKPGITDWASIKFHNEAEILKGSVDLQQVYRRSIRTEKMRLALEYLDERSLLTDVKIFLETFRILIKKRREDNGKD